MVRDGFFYGFALIAVAVIVWFGTHFVALTVLPALAEYREGQFLNAMNSESAVHNEQTMVTIDAGEYSVSFKQIAGLLARRILCNVREGDQVERGQRMGLIKFGSRVDVLLPASVELKVRAGQRVKGGSSVLAAIVPAAKTGQQP